MNLEHEVGRSLRPYVETGNFSGAVLVAEGATVLHCAGYGQANYELGVPCRLSTRFHIASVSKPFTALGVLLLERQGRLQREDLIGRYLPAFPGGDRITLGHLLTHTSGIPDVNGAPFYVELARSPQTPSSLVERISAWMRETGQPAKPGGYRYSNSNYNLLAAIIEMVSEKDYGSFLGDAILRPCGMTSTTHNGDAADLISERAAGYSPDGLDGVKNAPYIDWSSKTGNGSLVSTVEDLHRFHCALTNGEIVPWGAVVDALSDGTGNQYGWFARVSSHGRSMAATGRSPGFTASFERFQENDRCVVVLSNRYATVSQSPIAEDLARLLFGEPTEAAGLHSARASLRQLERFGGIYQAGDDFFTPNAMLRVDASATHLTLHWGDQRLPLIPLGGSAFRDRLYWALVQFEERASGEVMSLTWTYDNRAYRAKRVAAVPD